MQQNLGVNSFSGQPDSFLTEEEHRFASTKAEGQWQWDRDAQQMSPQLYSDGHGGNAGRSLYPNQVADTKMSSNQERRIHLQEQGMGVGYEDNPAPPTLESLDQKFHNDIINLIKEQDDAEDAENVRHKEKIIEINNQYQENLSALRVRHSARREELLRIESQTRLRQYQLAGVSPYQNNTGPSDVNQDRHGTHGYGAQDLVLGETHQQHGSGVQFDSYVQRHDSFGRGRMHGAADTRVPTPGGRVYSTGPRYY